MSESASGSSAATAKLDAQLTILTKTGEVLVLCYTTDCSKAKFQLAELSQRGYEEFNVIPKPIESHAVDSKLHFSIQAENDAKIRPSDHTLQLQSLKSGSPHLLIFKCYSPSGENVLVRLLIKEGGDIINEEVFDVTCRKKEIKTSSGGNRAAFMAGGNIENFRADGAKFEAIGNQNNQYYTYNYQQPAGQTEDTIQTKKCKGPNFFQRMFLGGFYIRTFLSLVNEVSYNDSLGGVTEKYDGQNLCEPDFEVYSRMRMLIRFFHGEHALNEPSTSDYTRERICNPSTTSPGETGMISLKKLRELISSRVEETRVIALLGMAGSGKSTLIKRLVRDIIKSTQQSGDQSRLPGFRLVRFLSIKDIKTSHSVNVQDLLFSQGTLHKVSQTDIHFGFKWAIDHDREILFALDGLDQAPWIIPTDFKKISYTEKASPGVVIANLLSGNLFKNAKILLTSREHSVASLCEELRPKTVIEMMGLDLKDVKKVFNALVSTHTDKQDAFQALSPAIIPLCTIPLFLVNCAIIFIINPGLRPKTMSAVVHEILDIFLHSDHATKRLVGDEGDRIINFFKSVSLKAILEGRVTFTRQEFQSAGITHQMISQFTIKVPGPSTHRQRLFDDDYKIFFSHQTLQEKFASMEICEKETSDFRYFAFNELCQPHLSVIRRFVCGLLSVLGKNSKLVSIKDREEKWNIFKETLRRQAENASSSDEKLELLALLYESQNQDLIDSLTSDINFVNVIFTPATVHALATILTSCRHLHLFRLESCQLDQECLDILDCFTYKAELQTDIAELDVSMANPQLLRFIGNLHPQFLVLLSDSSNTTPSKLVPSQLSMFPYVTVLVNAQSREVISFFIPLTAGKEPIALPAQHKIIVRLPAERPKTVDVIVIQGPASQLSELEDFIKYLRPKILILLATGPMRSSFQKANWSLDETCVLVFLLHGSGCCGLHLSSPFCQDTHIPAGYQEEIIAALKKSLKTVKRLDVTCNHLLRNKNGFVAVGLTVAQCKVEELLMRWCGMKGSYVKDFGKGVGDAQVRHLDISGNPSLRNDNGFTVVGSTVAQFKVEELVMKWCAVEASHVKDFGKGMGDAHVKHLNVSWNPELRNNNGFIAVGTTVAQCKVEELVMQGCKIEASHVKDLGNGLGDAHVRHLDVSFNHELRYNDGFVAVGSTVAQCKVEELVMKRCGMEASHVNDFGKGLGDARIRMLDLSGNFVFGPGEEVLTEITRIVRRNKVKALVMKHCLFGDKQLERFKQSIPGVDFRN